MSSASHVVFIFDTDALAQIYIANQHKILHDLRSLFGVSCWMMSEVEVELRSNKRIAGLIRPLLDKSLRNGLVKVITAGDLEDFARMDAVRPEVTLSEIRRLASELGHHVQIGEAHTFAAAYMLGSPAVSNDANAIRVLEANGMVIPPTILRSFDLFGFALQESIIDLKAAEAIRTDLRSRSEWVPRAMQNSSFEDGLAAFKCRLSTSLAISSGGSKWDDPFFLKRLLDR